MAGIEAMSVIKVAGGGREAALQNWPPTPATPVRKLEVCFLSP